MAGDAAWSERDRCRHPRCHRSGGSEHRYQQRCPHRQRRYTMNQTSPRHLQFMMT